MTNYEKEVRAMTNKELLDRLLFVVERNCFQCANKGFTATRNAKHEDILRTEAYKRFTEDKQP